MTGSTSRSDTQTQTQTHKKLGISRITFSFFPSHFYDRISIGSRTWQQVIYTSPLYFFMFLNHTVLKGFGEFDRQRWLCSSHAGKCLDRSDLLHKVFISDCEASKTTQKWEMNNIMAVWGKPCEYITHPHILQVYRCSCRAGQQLRGAGPCAPRV